MYVSPAMRAAWKESEVPRELVISWPWWTNPMWVLLLLTGSMAVLAVGLDESVYATWRVRKFLDGDLSLTLLAGILVMAAGILLGTGMKARGGSTTLRFTAQQIKYLRRGYRLMFSLALVSYVIWIASAASQGVNIADLLSVVDRDAGAISALKSNARPIGGLTTMTQFAPVVAVVGLLLRRIGEGGRAWMLLVLLAAVRTVFYAERLALLEVLIPVMLVAAVTVKPGSRWRVLARIAPLIGAPLVWVVFAMSEYTRSWIYYQTITNLPFAEWVSARLEGYYVTGFNNSAILALSRAGSSAEPYFSVPAIWNAPGAPAHPGIFGFDPESWWVYTLATTGNPEFNNPGSFLVTYAEFGMAGMLAFWLVVGVTIGLLYTNMTKGSVPAMIAYASVFVGVLELPRFIYWTQGRATPILIALVVIGLSYPRTKKVLTANKRLPKWASEPAGMRVLERANR